MKYLLPFLIVLLFSGCGPSSIKINTRINGKSYNMFGRIPERDFYVPVRIQDTIADKWEAEVNGNFTNSSVTAADSFLFVNDLSGRITCFRVDTGKRVGQLKNKGTIFSSPVLHKFFVIYADAYNSEDKSDLIFYDFSLGKVANLAEVPGRILTQLIKTEDGVILVTETGIALKYNFLGHKIWERRTGNFMHSSPVLSEGSIIFGNDDGEIVALDEESGEILYRRNYGSPFFGSATVSDKIAYIGNDKGELLALDVDTGDLKWKYHTGGRIIANPAADDQHIVAGNLKGEIFKLRKDGTLAWKQITGGIINAAPLLTINRIIVPDLSGKLHFVDYNTGGIMKTLIYPARVRLSPLIIGKHLYVGFDKGILKSYEIFY